MLGLQQEFNYDVYKVQQISLAIDDFIHDITGVVAFQITSLFTANDL